MATKPEWCKGIDVAMTVFFMLICDEHGKCSPSQSEIAKAVGGPTVNLEGMRKGLDRWLTTNGYGVTSPRSKWLSPTTKSCLKISPDWR